MPQSRDKGLSRAGGAGGASVSEPQEKRAEEGAHMQTQVWNSPTHTQCPHPADHISQQKYESKHEFHRNTRFKTTINVGMRGQRQQLSRHSAVADISVDPSHDLPQRLRTSSKRDVHIHCKVHGS
ncbi:unnamed protein product [Pleuronectes platessa]|uniref:Uncharacterized protein n=1 Tax=Pleuronectes platessa TaxID=8262 RepID=A0A9N7ZBU8_PLEPL|nr:unnamed protein product [Pleuronectes platessa]